MLPCSMTETSLMCVCHGTVSSSFRSSAYLHVRKFLDTVELGVGLEKLGCMPVASHHQELDEWEIHPQVLLCSFLWKTGLFCTTLPLLSLHHFLLRTEIPSFISATSDTFMKLQSCFKTRFRITKSCFYVLDVFLVTAVCFQHCLEKIEESKLFPSLLFGDKHWNRIKIRECSVESTFYLHLKNQPLERLKVVRNEKRTLISIQPLGMKRGWNIETRVQHSSW